MGIGVSVAPGFLCAFLSHADDIGAFIVPAQTGSGVCRCNKADGELIAVFNKVLKTYVLDIAL